MSGFGQTDPVQKQAGVQESSGPLLANASQPIRTGGELDPACLLGSYLEKKGLLFLSVFVLNTIFLLLLISGQLFWIFHSPAKQNILGKKTKHTTSRLAFK